MIRLDGSTDEVRRTLAALDAANGADRAYVLDMVGTRAADPGADGAVAAMAAFLDPLGDDDDVAPLVTALEVAAGPDGSVALARLLRGHVALPAALGGDGPELSELTRAHLRLTEPEAALAPPLRVPDGDASAAGLRHELTAEVALAMAEQLRTAKVELPQVDLAMTVFAARGRPALASGRWTEADRTSLVRQQQPDLSGSEVLSSWLVPLARATAEPADVDAATHFLARVRMVWLLTANAPAPA